MTRACANRGGKPAPYTKRAKRPYDYSALYRRHPHLRHHIHNPIREGFAATWCPVAVPPPEGSAQ